MNTPNEFIRIQSRNTGLTKAPCSPCRVEAESLLAMVEMLADSNSQLYGQLEPWREQVVSLIASDLEEDLATERKLENLAMELRRRWTSLAESLVAGEMKSPPVDFMPMLPSGASAYYVYERVRGTSAAEGRLANAITVPGGWSLEVAVFSTGMAAITAALTCLRRANATYARADGKPLRLDAFAGYYETRGLLGLISSSDLAVNMHKEQTLLFEAFSGGDTDILFLEMIAYDWQQSVINPGDLLESLQARSEDRPWILVIDSTLLGPLFQIAPLLDLMAQNRPLLVLDLRSGLKLDQAGLEFANAGVINILSHENLDIERFSSAAMFHESLVLARKLMGLGLSSTQSSILDAPWIFEAGLTRRHTEAVFDNNRKVALALSAIKGLFKSIAHPALGENHQLAWAESPMVVFDFHADEDTEENHVFLRAVIVHEVRKRGLMLYIGCSFGFRHHRCEVVRVAGNPHPDGRPTGYFKLAMGSRTGPSLEGAIELLAELCAVPNFAALKQRYSSIDPQKELVAFPDLQTLRLTR